MGSYWRTSRAIPGGLRQLPGSPHGSKNALPRDSVSSAEDFLQHGDFSLLCFVMGVIACSLVLISVGIGLIVWGLFFS